MSSLTLSTRGVRSGRLGWSSTRRRSPWTVRQWSLRWSAISHATATEEFFFRSGRTLLKCLCEVIIDREPSAINDFLSLMREELHPSTIYHLLRRGKLPAFKVGSDWRFSREAIDRWRLAQLEPRQ